MAKFSQSSHCIVLLLALISVNMMIAKVPAVEGATCYKILFDVICDNGNVAPKCVAACKQKCGNSAGASCIDQVGVPGPICACSFTANNCQTQRIC